MDYFISIYIFMFGALVTSFGLLIYGRQQEHGSILGRSKCDLCGHQLSLIDVVPILGYFINRGRCRHCNNRIDYLYPLFEILSGFLWLFTFIKLGNTTEFYIFLVAVCILAIESYIDIKTRLVSDLYWIIGSVILILIHIVYFTILPHLMSSLIMFISLYLLAIFSEKILKKETLGGGDIKLYLFIGMVLDLRLALLSLFLASVFGLIYAMIKKSKSDTYLPLVPFISLGVFVSYFWGNDLINWYLSLLGI